MQRILALAATLAFLWSSGGARAETVRLGASRLTSCSTIAIALAKGYFEAAGIEPKITYLDAQPPIPVALTSGDLDFGLTAETTALFTLAAAGKLKIIGGGTSETPGFHYLGLYASRSAYAKGLTSPKDLGGHSFALTQTGSGLQFILGQLADKYGFDLKTVRILPLQSNGNIASAPAGLPARADSAIFDPHGALPLMEKGDVKFLGRVGEIIELGTAYLYLASTDMADNHGDTVKRVLAAIRRATADYNAAFSDGRGKRADGPTAAETLAILAKHLNQPVDICGSTSTMRNSRSIGTVRKDFLKTDVPRRCHGRQAPCRHRADPQRARAVIQSEKT